VNTYFLTLCVAANRENGAKSFNQVDILSNVFDLLEISNEGASRGQKSFDEMSS
jgi:hypothetical protein